MNKTQAYRLLDELLEHQNSDVDRIHLLEDLIVNYFMYPEDLCKGDGVLSANIEMEVCKLMQNGLKIDAIKTVRSNVQGMGLKEAKEYVEGRTWGKDPLEIIVKKIRSDYL